MMSRLRFPKWLEDLGAELEFSNMSRSYTAESRGLDDAWKLVPLLSSEVKLAEPPFLSGIFMLRGIHVGSAPTDPGRVLA